VINGAGGGEGDSPGTCDRSAWMVLTLVV